MTRDADILESYAEDAARFPGGRAAGVALPESEAEIAALLRSSPGAVLPVGAQSSLTGGATPRGDLVLSTRKLGRLVEISRDRARIEAGVSLVALDEALERAGRAYPPVPTFLGASVGGIIATNAAGAATFKYGTTRAWVEALTVVLPDGDVLDIERGATRAHPDGYFDLLLSRGTVRVPVPRYRMPDLPKLSAGYFAAPDMDLIDLFIGSEGTLGIVTEVTLRVLPSRPSVCMALVPCGDPPAAMQLVRRLREAVQATWRTRDPSGIDVAAIEHMDHRSLSLIREDGLDRVNGVSLPEAARAALLITAELPTGTEAGRAFEEIGRADEPGAPDTPLIRLSRLLDDIGRPSLARAGARSLERAGGAIDVEIALPGDRVRAAQLLAVREAVPAAVNQRVARAKEGDPRIEKVAGDPIVPVEHLETLIEACREECDRRGLDLAIWGHVSDGNIHPNVIPKSYADVQAGKDAMLAVGEAAIALGGAPLAEHGVGRNPVKQALLERLYGKDGIEDMRRVKGAIDPHWRLAPGVLFQK